MRRLRTSKESGVDATNFPERCTAGKSCFVYVSGHGQTPRLRTDCTGWIRSEQMTTYSEESSGAPHHLSFAGVQLETTAEHPVTDGIHTVQNPDRKAFSLV